MSNLKSSLSCCHLWWFFFSCPLSCLVIVALCCASKAQVLHISFFCSNVVLLCQLYQFDSITDLSELDSPLLFQSNSTENDLFFWLALAKIRVETSCPFYSLFSFFFLSLSQHGHVVFVCNSLLYMVGSNKFQFPIPSLLHSYSYDMIAGDFNAILHIAFARLLAAPVVWSLTCYFYISFISLCIMMIGCIISEVWLPLLIPLL